MINKIIRRLEGKIPNNLWFYLMELTCKCKYCLDGYLYPQYGMAPHSHNIPDLKSLVGFIGSTEINDKSEWPDYFVEEKDYGQGVWWCKDRKCYYGINNTAHNNFYKGHIK